MFAAIKLALMVIVLAAFAAGGYYILDLQKNLVVAKENVAKLETAVEQNEEALRIQRENYEQVSAELNKVNEEFSNIRAQNNVLADKLAKHDLALLGSKKPKLVERVINNASVKAGRCFELLSGSELTDKEKEAKDGDSFNSECPWLWPGADKP